MPTMRSIRGTAVTNLLRGLIRCAWRHSALALAVGGALAACGPTAPTTSTTAPSRLAVPTPTPHIQRLSNITWSVPPSLEEQVFTSAVIVRASLQSATAVVETVPSDPGVAATYRPVQELRFTAHEYLKGSGPTTLLVVVRGGHTYVTETQARSAAARAVRDRVTTWDDRQGVLFLETPEPPYTPPAASGDAAGTASTPALEFTQSNYDQSPWDYSVDSLSRALAAGTGRRGIGRGGRRHGDVRPGVHHRRGASPPPVVSLTDSARQDRGHGGGVAGGGRASRDLRSASAARFIRERDRRADPWSPAQLRRAAASGARG